MFQPSLFDAVQDAFARHSEIDTQTLYREVCETAGVSLDRLSEKQPVGRAGQPRSTVARAIRWAQQTLKGEGLIARDPDRRGWWKITHEGRKRLCRLERGQTLLAFHTGLGLAVWGDCRDVADGLKEQIHLVLTSPPYPIRNQRAYGGIDESRYVGWLCDVLEPMVEKLADGGSLVLNISNDVFDAGKPSRSLYRERLVIELADRFGLHKMDELIWHNPSKPPGPIQWASKNRSQLNVAYEPVYWFCNNPGKCRADNRRVLEPHTERHRQLIAQGGTDRNAEYADGAYRLRPGAFGKPTPGRIPRNVMTIGHSCASQRRYKRLAAQCGLPVHGAPMPLALARKLVRFLSRPGDLVADPMAGSLTTGEAAELEGRRWICAEQYAEYVAGGFLRFDSERIEWRHPAVARACIPAAAG